MWEDRFDADYVEEALMADINVTLNMPMPSILFPGMSEARMSDGLFESDSLESYEALQLMEDLRERAREVRRLEQDSLRRGKALARKQAELARLGLASLEEEGLARIDRLKSKRKDWKKAA